MHFYRFSLLHQANLIDENRKSIIHVSDGDRKKAGIVSGERGVSYSSGRGGSPLYQNTDKNCYDKIRQEYHGFYYFDQKTTANL